MYICFFFIKFEIAGQDTIANAMTWMIKFVDENQQVFNTLMVSEYFQFGLSLHHYSLFFQHFLSWFLIKCCNLLTKTEGTT